MGKKKAQITIVVKEEVNDKGEHGYRVLHLNLLPSTRLPRLYLEGESVWLRSVDEPAVIYSKQAEPLLIKGYFYERDDFSHTLRIIERCGSRLMDVNSQLKDMREKWNKTSRIVI